MNSNTSTSQGKSIPLKAFGITLLLALLGITGAYFYGLNQGRAAVVVQKSESETQIQRASRETQKARDEVVAINNRLRLLDAQNGLYRAAVALDKRNFGIANTALQGAASALGRVKESEGIPLARVQSLAVALQKTDINVAANLENQRERLIGFAEQMEDMVKPAVASEVAPSELAPSLAPDAAASTEVAPDTSNTETPVPDAGTPTPDSPTPAPESSVE